MPSLQDLLEQVGTAGEVGPATPNDLPAATDTDVPDVVWDPTEASYDLDQDLGDSVDGDGTAAAQARSVSGASLSSAATVGSHLGALPQYSFETIAATPLVTIRVELATGNLLVSEHDLNVNSGGQALSVDRYYNSQTTREGSLGGGWTFGLGDDVGLTGMSPTSSSITVYGPSGFIATFTPTSGTADSWTGADGLDAMLTRQAGAAGWGADTYTVTYNQSGEKWVFDDTGWPIENQNRNSFGTTVHYDGIGVDYIASPANSELLDAHHETVLGVDRVKDFYYEMDGSTYSYDADIHGRLAAVTYPKDSPGGPIADTASTHSYSYVGGGNRLSTITLPSDNGTGQKIYSFSYDADGRVTGVALQGPSASSPTALRGFTYGSSTTTVTDGRANNSTYTFDSSGKATSYQDQLGRSQAQTWTTTNKVATTTGALATPNTTTYSYDALGNATGAQLPTGAATQAIYAQGTNCPQASTGTAYQVQCSISADGNKRAYDYDTTGNLLKVRDTTASAPGATQFEYTYTGCDGMGQPCTAKDANGHTTTYEYFDNGLIKKVAPPSPLGSTTYSYGYSGNWLSSVADGNGDTTSYVYNVRGNTLGISYQDGGSTAYTYSKDGLVLTETSVISDGGSGFYQTVLTHTYDERGREASRTTTQTHGASSAGHTESFTYDGNGNILTFVSAAGTETYTYDAANQLTSYKLPGGTCPTSGAPAASSNCVTFAYDDDGQETQRTFPGGAHQDTTYDAAGRTTRITATTASNGTAVDIGYSYAASGSDKGLIQTRTSFKEQGIPAGAVTTYAYDSASRLLTAIEKNGATTNASWSYSYDSVGNRTSQTRAGNTGATAGTMTYTYNAANELTAVTGDVASWSYDAAGQQTQNGQTGAVAQYGDRLQVTSLAGQAVQTAGAGNGNTLAIGGTTLTNTPLGLSTTTTSSLTTRLHRAPDASLTATKIGSSTKFYIRDHLGSVVGIFSATGTYHGGYSYSPYGETRFVNTDSTVTNNKERYIGGHLDEASGLYKLGARYYDTSTGRFTQMDPSGQGANPYSYAAGNPIVGSDPTGLVTFGQNLPWSSSIYFNRAETEAIATFGGIYGAALSTACTAINLYLGIACGAILSVVGGAAAVANGQGNCAMIVDNPVIGWFAWVEPYGTEHCY